MRLFYAIHANWRCVFRNGKASCSGCVNVEQKFSLHDVMTRSDRLGARTRCPPTRVASSRADRSIRALTLQDFTRSPLERNNQGCFVAERLAWMSLGVILILRVCWKSCSDAWITFIRVAYVSSNRFETGAVACLTAIHRDWPNETGSWINTKAFHIPVA